MKNFENNNNSKDTEINLEEDGVTIAGGNIDSRPPCDGRCIELKQYNPLEEPASIDYEKVKTWLAEGCHSTNTVSKELMK